jgi:hypothetical protein
MAVSRLSVFGAVLLCSVGMSCAPVQVLRLTSETFAPRPIQDVDILELAPPAAHLRLAELTTTSSTDSLETLQHAILKKAAKLGASAVIFSPPTLHTEQRLARTGYSPWGYYTPYYYGPGPRGSFGFGYGGMYGPWGPGWSEMDVPYMVDVQTLKGVAIRYTGF